MPQIVRLFFVLIFFPFTMVYPYIASLNNPNENVRTYMVMAVVDFHTFQIDQVLARHGYVNDMAKAPDPVTKQPHLYAIKAPALGYMGVPVYWAWTKIAPHFGHPVPKATDPPEAKKWWFQASTFVLRFFVVQIPAFIFLIFFERFLRAYSSDVALRLMTVAAVALGTNYLAYSLMFVSHTWFGIAAFTSFMLITRERALSRNDSKRRRAKIAFWAGFFAGMASLLEYQAFPVSCVLAIFAFCTFWRPTRLLSFLAGSGLTAAALMFYQWRCYNNPLTPGHKLAENPAFAAYHNQGFYGLDTPSWQTFSDLSFSHGYGFFGTSPFMYLGLLAFPFGLMWAHGTKRERGQRRVVTFFWLFAMLSLWIPISAAVNWRGGWTLGPRFFGGATPFFGFGALCALEQLSGNRRGRRAILRGIAGGLLIASVAQLGFTGLVFNTMPEDVTRPLAQIAIPLAHYQFVPHHVMELVGWDSPTFWYFVVGCLITGTLVAAFYRARERLAPYLVRVVVVVIFAIVGIFPAFSTPDVSEKGDGKGALAFFARVWEPPGRDKLAKAKDEAERYGRRGPCMWLRIEMMDRDLNMLSDAARAHQMAGDTQPGECKL
jgi:hypothetical protein